MFSQWEFSMGQTKHTAFTIYKLEPPLRTNWRLHPSWMMLQPTLDTSYWLMHAWYEPFNHSFMTMDGQYFYAISVSKALWNSLSSEIWPIPWPSVNNNVQPPAQQLTANSGQAICPLSTDSPNTHQRNHSPAWTPEGKPVFPLRMVYKGLCLAKSLLMVIPTPQPTQLIQPSCIITPLVSPAQHRLP